MEFPFVSKKKYNDLVYKIERLLCFASGNRFSKSTYSIEDMERMVSDYQESIVNDAIEDLQKQRNGHWIPIMIPNGVSMWGIDQMTCEEEQCSNCHKKYWVGEEKNYCPNCGAKMEREKE